VLQKWNQLLSHSIHIALHRANRFRPKVASAREFGRSKVTSKIFLSKKFSRESGAGSFVEIAKGGWLNELVV